MTARDDGGPAYPSEQGHTPEGTWNQTIKRGMSLRDAFAMAAPFTLDDALLFSTYERRDLTNPQSRAIVVGHLVAMRFAYADAMLEARKK